MCEFCKDGKNLYYENRYGNLYINHFGHARTLEIELSGCPPFADCCMKDIPLSVVYPINFCPNCGRDLKKQ